MNAMTRISWIARTLPNIRAAAPALQIPTEPLWRCSRLGASIGFNTVRHFRPPIVGTRKAGASRLHRRQQKPPINSGPLPTNPEPQLFESAPPSVIQNLAGIQATIPPSRRGDVLGPDQRHQGVRSVLAHPALVISRQLEMLNVLIGYEQANRYVIKDPSGNIVGFIVEEDLSLSNSILRQLLRTRRAYRAKVLDSTGAVVLHIERPIKWWINSIIYVYDVDGTLIGETKQVWHLWRRKYDVFVQKRQFAEIDAGFWSWDFELVDESAHPISFINRFFVGITREIFTDTGKYAIQMDNIAGKSRLLSLDERAVMVGTAMTIDIDYFSRHSHSGGGWLPIPIFGFGAGDSTQGEDVATGLPSATNDTLPQATPQSTSPFPIFWPGSSGPSSPPTNTDNSVHPPLHQHSPTSQDSRGDQPFLTDDEAGIHSEDDSGSWSQSFQWFDDDED